MMQLYEGIIMCSALVGRHSPALNRIFAPNLAIERREFYPLCWSMLSGSLNRKCENVYPFLTLIYWLVQMQCWQSVLPSLHPLFHRWLAGLWAYLIFVIFFTQAKFLENKTYTEKRQFLPIFRQFLPIYTEICTEKRQFLPIFRA